MVAGLPAAQLCSRTHRPPVPGSCGLRDRDGRETGEVTAFATAGPDGLFDRVDAKSAGHRRRHRPSQSVVAERGTAPALLRMDNGPELTSAALRDWCRFNAAGTALVDPCAPWQNGCVDSFNARPRDELLSGEVFDTLTEARVLIEDSGAPTTTGTGRTQHWAT